jgi:methylamine methyltransferase corrinoid protein reductive activase
MDAQKAGRLGLIPPGVKTVRQVGNTSLAMARDLVVAPEKLEVMNDLACRLRQTHCMFALSKIFSRLYILELAHWTEGMPMDKYRELLRRYQLPDLVPMDHAPQVIRAVKQDIDDLGQMGLQTLEQVGRVSTLQVEGCSACMSCVRVCPADAITIHTDSRPTSLSLAHALCNGVACRRCESGCSTKVFHLNAFFDAAAGDPAGTENPHWMN